MIQARTVVGDSPVGYFTNYTANYQSQCGNDVSVYITYRTCMFLLYLQTAATHTNNADKNFVILIWMSPPVGTGAIRFRCYIII